MTSTTAVRFALVGLLGWIVDLTLFQALWRSGLELSVAHVSSFFVAAATNYVLNSRWAFVATSGGRLGWLGLSRFLTVSLLALFLRGGVLAVGHERFGLSPAVALCAAIVTAALINYLGCAFYVFPRPAGRSRAIRWRTAAIGVIGYAVLLRLVYLGLPDLIPQEAYYWNYAQHPALSYLDHPPMVAWLITMGTAVFGDTELGVRVGAYACWFVSAGFLFRLARHLYDKATALKAVMLAAALPFFLVSGFVATPDAPLVACWAGALFFLERALLAEKRLAWWGVGACLGLGMLSKYTIVLLAAAALVFVLLDRRSRRWLTRPEPYAATLLASLLFLPVIVWNVHNGWASFAFQSTRRLTAPPAPGLHILIAWILVLITPVGAIAAFAALVPPCRALARGLQGQHAAVCRRVLARGLQGQHAAVRRRVFARGTQGPRAAARQHLFTTVLTLVPLAVLVLFSLRHEPKLNWTGPLWLAVLPAIARQLPGDERRAGSGVGALAPRAWAPALVATLLLFGALLHYVTIGLPGVPYSAKGSLPIAWEELGQEVEAIEDALEGPLTDVSDQEILVVGMDKYFLASALAFYRPEGSEHTASRHLFGRNGLMYAEWFPAEQQRGRTLLLVSLDRGDLADERLAAWVEHLGPIQTRVIEKHGRPALRFHVRVAEDYRPQVFVAVTPWPTPPPHVAMRVARLRLQCSRRPGS